MAENSNKKTKIGTTGKKVEVNLAGAEAKQEAVNNTVSCNVLNDTNMLEKYEDFKDEFLKLNFSVSYDTDKDKTICLMVVGHTGIKQFVNMVDVINHSNTTDGLANIEVIVIDSTRESIESYADMLPKHTFIKIGDESVDGMGSEINAKNIEIFKASITDQFKELGIFDKYFGILDVHHMMFIGTGGGTGGTGFQVLSEMYAEKGQPVIINAVMDSTDNVSGGNATKAYKFATELLSEYGANEFPPIINFNENAIAGRKSVDTVGMVQLMGLAIMLSGESTNIESSEIRKRIYGITANQRRVGAKKSPAIYKTEIVIGPLLDSNLELSNSMLYIEPIDGVDEVKSMLNTPTKNAREVEFKNNFLPFGLTMSLEVHSNEYIQGMADNMQVSIAGIVGHHVGMGDHETMDVAEKLAETMGDKFDIDSATALF